MHYNLSPQEMANLRAVVAEARQMSIEELEAISDDAIVEFALQDKLIEPFTPDQLLELRQIVAQYLNIPLAELATMPDAGIIEMAVRHQLI